MSARQRSIQRWWRQLGSLDTETAAEVAVSDGYLPPRLLCAVIESGIQVPADTSLGSAQPEPGGFRLPDDLRTYVLEQVSPRQPE